MPHRTAEVTVGTPHITSVTPDEDGLEGGARVVVEGENFAPETTLTRGDAPVTDYTVKSARRIEFVVPGQTAPGARTLSVVTHGGVDQRAFGMHATRGIVAGGKSRVRFLLEVLPVVSGPIRTIPYPDWQQTTSEHVS
jgi:hypothetical protein